MKKEFVLRGNTASGKTEKLSFTGHKKGYAYKMTDFKLYPADNIGGNTFEFVGSVTAGKTAVLPTDVNFDNEGLIATTYLKNNDQSQHASSDITVINDTFLITQDLILMVQETAGVTQTINWQCRFESVKMSGSEEAVANYRQFTISDG